VQTFLFPYQNLNIMRNTAISEGREEELKRGKAYSKNYGCLLLFYRGKIYHLPNFLFNGVLEAFGHERRYKDASPWELIN
jgi:hypothetical protein